MLLNSRFGRNLEEVVVDGIVQGWHRFGLRAIMGLFWFVVDLFRAILEAVERMMYAVDEWLRFKSGESGAALAGKAVLGLLWSIVAYVLRFAVNVLIEPQINPIKHFPVVTVSHKFLLPLIPHFCQLFSVAWGWKRPLAGITATAIIAGVPGLFGFLVWELTANWRLYAANRRPNLAPGADRRARRNDGPPAEGGFPLGHAPQAVRQAPPRGAPRPGRQELERRP